MKKTMLKTPMTQLLFIGVQRRPQRGLGLKDSLMNIGNWSKSLVTAAYTMATPWVNMKNLLWDWMDLINWARRYGRDLPDIVPELSLFIEQSETGPSTVQTRNKAIIARLKDMNTRYLQLNTTPYKDAFNRIMATTTLNSIRAPDKAPEYIATAELDLGQLYRNTLGSNQAYGEEQPVESWPQYIANIPAKVARQVTPQPVMDFFYKTPTAKLYDKYTVTEPHDIVKRHEREDALPSSIIGRVQFPDAQVSGQYVPSYVKPQYNPAPLDLYPVFKRMRGVDPTKTLASRPKKDRNRGRRYKRGRKMRQ